MKNSYLIIILLSLLLITSGCSQNAIKGCTLEAKVCPDGTAVGRHGPFCEFDACPEINVARNTTNNTASNIPDYLFCNTVDDCACGVSIQSRDCLVGNKKYVDTTQQCPDYCTGFDGRLVTKCIDHQCKTIHQ